MTAPRRTLLVETSHRLGRVALAEGDHLAGERLLDEPRRQARDLAPAVLELLAARGWTARSLEAVFVSRGPGSYTGLRVGVMSAKMLAYATGCALLAVDTFAALARQATGGMLVDVIADAQQDRVYVQRFRAGAEPVAVAPLAIHKIADWIETLTGDTCVNGPGLEQFADRLPAAIRVVERDGWFPQASSLLAVGLARWRGGERDDPFAVEPLYLRPSSAEEKWRELGR
jgi:tRNA threonylcarbamoyladenosine biosynthesis protein TsaB